MDIQQRQKFERRLPSNACGSLECTIGVTDSSRQLTSGSSEAAMLGGMAMKRRCGAAANQLGKSTEKPNLITGSGAGCWHKFALTGMIELRRFRWQGAGPDYAEAEVIARSI